MGTLKTSFAQDCQSLFFSPPHQKTLNRSVPHLLLINCTNINTWGLEISTHTDFVWNQLHCNKVHTPIDFFYSSARPSSHNYVRIAKKKKVWNLQWTNHMLQCNSKPVVWADNCFALSLVQVDFSKTGWHLTINQANSRTEVRNGFTSVYWTKTNKQKNSLISGEWILT